MKKARGRTKAKPSRAKLRVTAKRAGDAGRLFKGLVGLQKRLRAANGCPWDREQTHESLRPFLIEEAYEVLDAMQKSDAQKFAGELGDLLLQIVFHAELAREAGRFDIGDVIHAVHTKMVRRHPHVFGKVKAHTPADVLKNWEQIKAEERAGESKAGQAVKAAADDSVLAGVPRGLPALLEAYQLTRRAANVGFDWENIEGVLEKLEEEISELREALRQPEKSKLQAKIEEELGDLLFAAVNVARLAGADPELALKRANAKFTARFQWMESKALERARRFAEVPRDEMEKLWDQAKAPAKVNG
ncbi:MAG TPA: nucleoside triphosphate pyrophosphohydrolase [Candidatus Acidoferrales bacterium]|nr:nucleoside triphosphate pyrophosphohydrolase [Candidatus Acidoferrales bacterium]